jgi:PhoPQ-activated pathogenicity-related protein
MSQFLRLSVLCLVLCSPVFAEDRVEEAPPNSLQTFVNRAEPAFRWEVVKTTQTDQGAVHQIHLVSQEWQGIAWEHTLQVYEPREMVHPEHVLLFVTGGKIGGQPREEEVAMGLQLAQRCGGRVATLHQVPNQPLLGDRVEDDLITETWLRYLKTGDENWPLLFPMVKSAVKAMDAVEQFVKGQGGRVEGFVITGASKRGWTSWLTPVADKRIIATAPIVINTLNFPAQMKYQIETWGEYSEQIADYTSKGLVKAENEPQSPRERMLWRMMDPYVYRQELSLPKLMIVGTNDRYWVVDAMTLYWDGLVGPKYVLQVPNAGHGLDDGKDAALTTLAVFFRHAAAGRPLPKLDWKLTRGERELSLAMTADPPPAGVRFWTAGSTTKDFRESKWTSSPIEASSAAAGTYEASVTTPEGEHSAVFAEFQYEYAGLKYSLTTQAYRN